MNWRYPDRASVAQHPRGKATVHPTKLLVRRALIELEEVGIVLRDKGYGNKVLFRIFKDNPERAQSLIAHIKASSSEEQALWHHVLKDSWDGFVSAPARGTTVDGLDTLVAILPYVSRDAILRTTKTPRNVDNTASLLSSARSTMRYIEQALGSKTTDCDPLSLLRAARIVMNIHEKITTAAPHWARTQKTYMDTQVNKKNIEDVLYIARDVDAVLPIIPELIKRKTHDKGMVEALIRTPNTVLLEGVL